MSAILNLSSANLGLISNLTSTVFELVLILGLRLQALRVFTINGDCLDQKKFGQNKENDQDGTRTHNLTEKIPEWDSNL